MSVLMKTAFTDDHHDRVKALNDIATNCNPTNLHTMVQSVKNASNIVMSSVLMQELQQQICGKEILDCIVLITTVLTVYSLIS